jgi:hypothetical protein
VAIWSNAIETNQTAAKLIAAFLQTDHGFLAVSAGIGVHLDVSFAVIPSTIVFWLVMIPAFAVRLRKSCSMAANSI